MSTISSGTKKKLSYFKAVQAELKKVTWTSKKELFSLTKAVILATFTFGLAIYAVDLLIRGSLNGMTSFLKMIFG